jgi:hexosaminidase
MTSGIHLDLKGLPPTPQRLLSLLDLLAAVQINAVLVEWEDSFPWTVDERFRSPTAYTPAEVNAFIARARELDIQIIPLVQSLGHMETPLRLNDYAALREVPDRCDVLNPLADGARQLVERMVDDVLAQCGPMTHFHLGGDEAWTFGTHPGTRAFIERHGKGALYLHHIEPLLDKLLARNIRPILWHDMMHDWDEPALSRLAAKADLMVWSYRGDPRQRSGAFGVATIERFARADVTMWGACAYKGAEEAHADLPNIAARVANAEAWSAIASQFKMRGVIATAWSRFSTHRVQCEPIDGALDALVKVATALRDGNAADDAQTREILKQSGEYIRFKACRDALAQLSEARKSAWQYELYCREQLAIEAADARRRGSGILAELRRIQGTHIDAARAAGDTVRAALDGLIERVWVDEYIDQRLKPLA